MKRSYAFGLSLAALMAACSGLRWWQRSAAFEPDTGLLTPHAPATYCLVAAVALGAVALLLLSRWVARETKLSGYLAAFSTPWSKTLWLYMLAGALLVAAGVLGIQAHRMGLDSQFSRYVLSICLCPAGVGVVMTGWLNGCPEEGAGRFAWPLLVPGYVGCVWLIAIYQSRITQPNLMGYAFYLLGAVCAVLCCYAMASFSFEKPMPATTLWLGGMALILLGMSAVADFAPQGQYRELLVSGGYLLYLAAQLGALVHRCHVPAQLTAWTPPQEDEPEAGQEDEIEVSDHE